MLRGFPQDQQLMRRSRNQSVPPIPKDLDDIHDILNFQPEWRSYALGLHTPKEFFAETVHVDNAQDSRVSVMVSPYFDELLKMDRVELALDATFDVR